MPIKPGIKLNSVDAAIWAIVVLITSLFLVDGGLNELSEPVGALGAISRLTSLIGTALLLMHMLLVARVPWIENVYGRDQATVLHKRLGKPVFYLILAHFVSAVMQFSLLNSEDLLQTLWWFITEVPDMLPAGISLILMIVVVITSLNFARRRLGHKTWFVFHIISYAAVALAVPHVFSTGTDIAGKPIQTVLWVSLYLFVFLNVLWFRVWTPIRKDLSSKRSTSAIPFLIISMTGAAGLNFIWLNPIGTLTGSADDATKNQTVTGDIVEYKYGVVQLEISVTNGKIENIKEIQATASGSWSQSISVLHDEALKAQSADFGNVSGATFISEAYREAFASALSKLK